MFTRPCVIVILEEWKTNLMSLAILFHFLCAQHVSDINMSIIRSLRLCCWITTSVVLFSVRCVLEIWWGWVWVVLVLQAEGDAMIQWISMLCFIVFNFVCSILVCILLDDGGWLPKHVEGIKKLCVYCVWKCWFEKRSIIFDSWRMKDQLDVTCYFISLFMCSTCFGH